MPYERKFIRHDRLRIQHMYTYITIYVLSSRSTIRMVAEEVLMLQELDRTTAHGMQVLSHHYQDDR